MTAQRDSRIGQASNCARHLGRQLVGMGEVHADPERMVPFEHSHQRRRDALRQRGGNLRAHSQQFHMLDGAQPRKQPLELLVRQQKRIASGKQHVANLGVGRDIFDRCRPLLDTDRVPGRVADHPRACAVTAVDRADRGHQEQHPIGIAMHQSGRAQVAVLVQRVVRLVRTPLQFVGRHDDRAAQRIVGSRLVQKAGIVRRDLNGQLSLQLERRPLAGG